MLNDELTGRRHHLIVFTSNCLFCLLTLPRLVNGCRRSKIVRRAGVRMGRRGWVGRSPRLTLSRMMFARCSKTGRQREGADETRPSPSGRNNNCAVYSCDLFHRLTLLWMRFAGVPKPWGRERGQKLISQVYLPLSAPLS